MTDLTSLGYPQGYHLGLSSLLWWIYIIVTLILGFGLYLNAKKSDLINVKEILRAKAFFYIGTAIHTILFFWNFLYDITSYFLLSLLGKKFDVYKTNPHHFEWS